MPTIIVIPEADIAAGNAWAAASVANGSPGDLSTFGAPNFSRAGVNFAVASYNDAFEIGTRGRGTLAAPAWDTGGLVNMGAATNFQTRMRYRDPSEAAGMSNANWQNFPNMFDTADPFAMLESAGFSQIVDPNP